MKISIIVRRYQSGQSSLFTSSICAMSCLDCLRAALVGCCCFFYVSFIAFSGFAGIMMFGMGIHFKISDGSEAWPSETWLIGGAFVLLDVLLVTLTIYCCRYGCCWNNNQENWQQVSYININDIIKIHILVYFKNNLY